MNRNDLEALRALEADASKLQHLESLTNRFNVFETIGFINQELTHSRFLAFLLDPRQSHGLGDVFLAKFLNEASLHLDLHDKDLDLTLVHREWQHVDILLVNETHRFAVIIENKIWTTEHSDQLDRYYRIVRKGYPGWQVFGVYLTPYGSSPSHEAYSFLSYETVCEVLDEVLEEAGSMLASSDVRMSVEHYVQMVRRRILEDPEIVRLCQQIYRKHKQALDLIYKHRPDHQASNRRILTNLVGNTEGLVLTGKWRGYVWFHLMEWEASALQVNNDPNGFFRFVFHNSPDGVDLYLETSPGNEATRRGLFEMGKKDEALFNSLVDPDTDEWPSLYHRTFLTPELSEDGTDHEREDEIRRQWGAFLIEDLPRIRAAIKKETWIWESVEADG